MLAKIGTFVLNWITTAVVLPAIYYVWDYLRLKKIEKNAKKAASELEAASTKNDIDKAVDKMP